MRYLDLTEKTKSLPLGKHVIAELETGRVTIENVGSRHHYMSPRSEYRLVIETGGKRFTPRHGDFLSDVQLKSETRPDLRLALFDSCDALCNGAAPSELMTSKKLPAYFGDITPESWSLQSTQQQMGGLSTELLLHGLQGLIRVFDLNDPTLKAPETFRKAFLDLQGGMPPHEAAQRLRPQVMGGKRYFDALERS
ncbi:MAG: hypothetical protein IPK53_02650 [bacterium]|nr:hypothetical protein [bacterium]MBK8127865.1 hypothetical protein [bacterium]